MSQDAIGDVGETLVGLLRDGIDSVQDDQIALSSPADAEGNARIRLTLFLYSVLEYPEMKNEPYRATGTTVTGTTEIRPAPLSLNLYYLVTAHPASSAHGDTVDAHKLLGRAMQIFYDNGILSGSLLKGNLSPDQELRLTLNPITLEDLTRVWSVFPNTGYRLSVSYLVTPARIDSERFFGTSRVVEKTTETHHLVPTPQRL